MNILLLFVAVAHLYGLIPIPAEWRDAATFVAWLYCAAWVTFAVIFAIVAMVKAVERQRPW